MRAVPSFFRAATTLLILGAAIAPAHAFDLTGHWVGKFTCKRYDGTKLTFGNKNSTLDITQAGSVLAANIDAAIPPPDGDLSYNGVAILDQKSPDTKGEVVLYGCHLANTPAPIDPPGTPLDGELARAAVKTKVGIFKATLKAVSIFQDDKPEVGSCKYSYKRIDTIDPAVPACPP